MSGCQKERDEVKTLSGTIWEEVSGQLITTLSFDGNICKRTLADPSYEETWYYSYEYTDPVVILYPVKEGLASMKGIISGNTMSVVNLSTQKTIGTFIKR